MYVLGGKVKDHHAAVVIVAQFHAVGAEEVQYNGFAQLSQISGDDQVIAGGLAPGFCKVSGERTVRRGGHGRPHVVGILDTLVHHLADGGVCDIGAVPITAKDGGAGAGHRPLCGGGALPAVLQGGAVLPLSGAEVGGGHRRRPGAEAAVQRHGGHDQPFRHGGAGAVKPEKGHILATHGKGGGDTLVEQVAGEEHIQGRGSLPRLVQGALKGQPLHGALRFLPAGLSKAVILIDEVEEGGHRAVTFFFAHHAGIPGNGGRIGKGQSLPAQLFYGHSASSHLYTACLNGISLNRFPQNIRTHFGGGTAGQMWEDAI